MIVTNTKPRLIACNFLHAGNSEKVSFPPGDTKINTDLAKSLLKHPGFKNKVDFKILKIKDSPKPNKPTAKPADKNESQDK